MDSNHRSLRQQIYSLPPLASREFPHYGAGDGTRTRNLLITNQLLCRLSYTSIICLRLCSGFNQWMSIFLILLNSLVKAAPQMLRITLRNVGLFPWSGKSWWPMGESNPRYRRERAMSWPLDQWAISCTHGRGDRTWTCGPMVPNHVRYHLRYTPTRLLYYIKNKNINQLSNLTENN